MYLLAIIWSNQGGWTGRGI